VHDVTLAGAENAVVLALAGFGKAGIAALPAALELPAEVPATGPLAQVPAEGPLISQLRRGDRRRSFRHDRV
jgi:hypothetical protein